MDNTPVSLLRLQISHARQRLFWQTWLNHLPACWAVLLVLAAGWLLLQPYWLGLAAPWLRWTLLGGVLALGAVLAVAWTWWRGPSQLEAALALDERFGLKERVTTALTLTEEQTQTSAGQALLSDVQQQLTKLHVGSRFPLRLGWQQTVLPVLAAMLAVLALLFEPTVNPLTADAKDANVISAAKAEAIEKAREEVKKKLEENKKLDQPKSKQLKELELKMEQLFDKAVDPKDKDEIRKEVDKIQELEKKNDQLLKEAQKAQQKQTELENKLKDLDKAANQDKDKNQDGPAKDLMEALNKGDSKKVEEELKKLQEKLEKSKLSEEEMKKLTEQIANLQKQAEKMAEEQKDLAKQLEEAKKNGETSKEKQEQLEQAQKQQEEMQKLSEELKECQNCTKEGDGKKAAEKLGKAGEKMKKAAAKAATEKADLVKEMKEAGQKAQDMKQLQQNQKMLQEARQTICQNMGMGGGQPDAGPRPAKKTDTGMKDAQEHGEVDPKGQFKVIGEGPNTAGSKNMIPSKELPGVFEKTAQDAQQAIERQPISQEAAELLKGYYQNLSGQKK